MTQTTRTFVMPILVALTCLAGVHVATAQVAAPRLKAEDLAGIWEGAAQGTSGDISLHAEFTVQDGKLVGFMDSSMGRVQIVSVGIVDDQINITFDIGGMTGVMGAKLVDKRIEGLWEVSGGNGSFRLARPAAAAAPAADPISGEWAGEVVTPGQTMAFSMTLKLNGETVTGDMMAPAGTVPLASGNWKDGTLLIAFPYVGGEPITMTAQLQDGKLSGVLDYNKGEMAGTWTASRKAPVAR
jgi:hypothetical protein